MYLEFLFEFKKEGSFYCDDFSSGGFHNQIEGTWSDDTSVLLCLIDALSNKGKTALWKFKQFQKTYIYGIMM